MLGSKFGAAFGDVPALYVWQRLGREKNVATRGYPAGGYESIIDALRASIESTGGRRAHGAPRSPGSRADGDGVRVTLESGEEITADWAISTRAAADPARRRRTRTLAPKLPTVSPGVPGRGQRAVLPAQAARRALLGAGDRLRHRVRRRDRDVGAVRHAPTACTWSTRCTTATATASCSRDSDEAIAQRWTEQLLAHLPGPDHRGRRRRGARVPGALRGAGLPAGLLGGASRPTRSPAPGCCWPPRRRSTPR